MMLDHRNHNCSFIRRDLKSEELVDIITLDLYDVSKMIYKNKKPSLMNLTRISSNYPLHHL